MAWTSTQLPLAGVGVGSYTSSSDSGGETSVSGRSSRGPGVRTVTLSRRSLPGRPNPQPCLGFSLRGGREHGTGFFVSAVERGSEAYMQGLTIGDQIIRINGLPVEDASHREVLHLIQSQNPVTFKVRSVGMIPVKDTFSDSLTWRLVEPEPGGPLMEPSDLRDNVQLIINVAPKAKLGCGIMKGPEWKPGIFVQYTKENSLARGAGLKPGDQIIQCNNAVFTPDIPFNEAVSVLRSTGLLELVIQKGVGLDLFPGESSGYNSSASSVAGDQSPETWPNKRLSVVREESIIDSDSRLTSSELSRTGERHKDFERNLPPSQFPMKPHATEGACTVIRVGPDIEGNGESERNPYTKLAEICMVSQQLETKTTTVLVEVHQSGEQDTVNSQSDSSLCNLTNSSTVSSFSSSGANSLCSAISQELQRRSENRAKEPNGNEKPPKVELHKCGMDKDKVEQHQLLMEEFKRAHKKMFAHTLNEANKTENSRPQSSLANQTKEERESFRIKRQQKEVQHAAKMDHERAVVAVKERDLRLERDKQDMSEAERELTRLVRRQQTSIPPPPPLPTGEINQSSIENGFHDLESSLPPLPPFPPDCPTPDYDKASLASEASTINKNQKDLRNQTSSTTTNANSVTGDFVEMQSLESFKLTNPSVAKPKPPPIYFNPNLNGSTTSSMSSSKISCEGSKPTVTIREYPKNAERKNPERFQFLGQNGTNRLSNLNSGEPLSSRLQDELTQTLSKAKLKCDSSTVQGDKIAMNRIGMGKNTVTISITAQPKVDKTAENNLKTEVQDRQAPFYLHNNGNSNHNNYNNAKDQTRKISTTVINQTFNNTSGVKIEEVTNKNSVTLNSNQAKDKTDLKIIHPNGILKNGVGGNIAQLQIHPSQQSKSPSKSIKFAGM